MKIRLTAGAEKLSVISKRYPEVFLLTAILAMALVTRLIFIESLPLGFYCDEIFTFENVLSLFHRPLDLFGTTPLLREGWVATPNLYLYFNWLIVRLFGVSYLSLKLFSVVPGIIGCIFFYLAGTRILPTRLAFWTATLFVFSHWHIRLSRHGWDNTFMVMMFAASLWLLFRALDGKKWSAIYAGVASGLGMYSYIAAVVCFGSLALFLGFRVLLSRKRSELLRLLEFVLGAAVVTLPLLAHYLQHQDIALVRVRELSIFQVADPRGEILKSILQHALMFHWRGGLYARDDFPGLPMLSHLSGILMLIGLFMALRRASDKKMQLILIAFAVNLAGGVFSISQEGAPYVYRISAIIIPTFLLVGLGLQGVADAFTLRRLKYFNVVLGVIVICDILFNIHDFFYLEKENVSESRMMNYELRQVGLALRGTTLPVYLMMPDALENLPDVPLPNEPYFECNHDLPCDPITQRAALAYFSGRYDLHRDLGENLQSDGIFFAYDLQDLEAIHPPAVIVFRGSNRVVQDLLKTGGIGRPVNSVALQDLFGREPLIVATVAD